MNDYKKLNIQIAKHYGYDNQSNQLIEECAELIQAINKHKRVLSGGQKTELKMSQAIENIIEEIADVELMLEQIKYLLSINTVYVEGVKQQKVMRTMKKIESGEQFGQAIDWSDEV